jgi:hypothetical protein
MATMNASCMTYSMPAVSNSTLCNPDGDVGKPDAPTTRSINLRDNSGEGYRCSRLGPRVRVYGLLSSARTSRRRQFSAIRHPPRARLPVTPPAGQDPLAADSYRATRHTGSGTVRAPDRAGSPDTTRAAFRVTVGLKTRTKPACGNQCSPLQVKHSGRQRLRWSPTAQWMQAGEGCQIIGGMLAVRNPARWAAGGCVTGSDLDVIETARLLVRPAQEADRERFIKLFGNEDFMVYYPGGALSQDEARRRSGSH